MRFALKVLASTVVAGAAVLAGAPSAIAAPRHVGIVVRYADGRVAAGCTTVGGSGLQVLERKHSVTMGTQQYSGFVLRIDGTGTSRPDNTHYWSYWHSSGHGGWTYASSGAASYTPRAGTVEGWSFVNGQNSAPPPPSYTYAALCGNLDPKPEPKATSKPKPTAAPTTQSPAPPPHTAAAHVPRVHRAPVTRPVSTAPTTATRSRAALVPAPPRRHGSRSAPPSASASRASSVRHRHNAQSVTASPPTSSATTTAAPSPVAQPVDSSTSAAWPTVGALVVIAALGATAWFLARHRTG